MKHLQRIFILFCTLAALTVCWFAPAGSALDDTAQEIVVGVYECAPYYMVDADGNVSGFYDDLLKLLESQSGLTHTYRVGSFQENLEWLEDGSVDICLGISIQADRLEHMIFSGQSIGSEYFALYSNVGDLNQTKSYPFLRVGVVPDSTSAQFVINYLSSLGLNIELVEGADWNVLQQMFDTQRVDLIPQSIRSDYDPSLKVYEFTGDQVYIAGSRDSREILDQLDSAIAALHRKTPDPMQQLYDQYFTPARHNYLLIALAVCLAAMAAAISIPGLHRWKMRRQIRENMQQERYLLQYQPIYDPNRGQVVGFEALLRLMADKKMIPPLEFLPAIEKNGMLHDVSLWIIQKALQDYQIIRSFSCMSDKQFYISVNISLNEIENKQFARQASELLQASGIGPGHICLEIIERVKMKDLAKATQNLKQLKDAGYKIAIDDFGTEYSNFDLLLKLNLDVVKVDRSLVTNIHQDSLKREVVHFITQIARIRGKDVVLEGVEEAVEAETIRGFHNERVFVQGFFYSKPLFREDLETLCIR